MMLRLATVLVFIALLKFGSISLVAVDLILIAFFWSRNTMLTLKNSKINMLFLFVSDINRARCVFREQVRTERSVQPDGGSGVGADSADHLLPSGHREETDADGGGDGSWRQVHYHRTHIHISIQVSAVGYT